MSSNQYKLAQTVKNTGSYWFTDKHISNKFKLVEISLNC